MTKEKANWLDFDWCLNESNLVKVLEGKYDNGKSVFNGTGQQSQQRYIPKSYEEAEALYGRKRTDAIDVEAREVTQNDTGAGLRALC